MIYQSKLVNAIQNSYQKYSKLQITELPNRLKVGYISDYRKVVSSSPSHFEAHAGLFRLLMKGIFDAYVFFEEIG